jgi:hypothetical protein
VSSTQERDTPTNPSLAHLPTESVSSKSMRRGERPSPCRASLLDGANVQVLIEKVCETGPTTKSPSSKYARRGEQSSPGRASLRDGVTDQVPAEQVYETGRTTKSLQERNLGRCCRPTSVVERRNITKPRLDRTYSSKRFLADTMEHPRVRRRTYPH